MRDKVLIGYGQGFWGDSILGPLRLVREGPLDYLALDYLAEVTMSIMQKQKGRNPDSGYATDFLAMLDRTLLEDLLLVGDFEAAHDLFSALKSATGSDAEPDRRRAAISSPTSALIGETATSAASPASQRSAVR